jgi:hypothetical protein
VAAVIEPTSQQCTDNVPIQLDDGQTGYACWYPQMGGYVSHCIVVGAGGGECFEAYVWHDGDFPFSDDDVSPRELHHCDAGQFIRFGEWVQSLGDR